MRAKTIKELLEAGLNDLSVSANHSIEDLVDMVHSAERMLKKGVEPLLHTQADYKKSRKEALAALKKNHKLSKKEIKSKLDESVNTRQFLNEVFDVLTWSTKHLPKAIARDIEEAHEGGMGEKFQTSLLKVMNKEELLKWYNKNFEVGDVNEYNKFQRTGDSKEALSLGAHRFNNVIDSNDLELLCNISGQISPEDDIQMVYDYIETEWGGLEDEEVQRALYLWNLYVEGKVEPDEFFDHKELERMEAFISKNLRGRYVYNGTPGYDGWQVVFSKIRFPEAEELID